MRLVEAKSGKPHAVRDKRGGTESAPSSVPLVRSLSIWHVRDICRMPWPGSGRWRKLTRRDATPGCVFVISWYGVQCRESEA